MLYEKKEFTTQYGDREVTFETGRLAKQADGAVLVTCGGTQVLATVCSAREVNDGQDFFPLMVDYKEKFYSAGKFLGGFMKREGRPSTAEILLMRMIDRPFRPLFPEGYMAETIITAQVMSFDEKSDPEITAALACSAALAVSDIPFSGPVGFAKVGKIDGKLVLNPNHEQLVDSELELIVAGSSDAVLMVEGEAKQVSEQVMLEAIEFAHDRIKEICQTISQMKKEAGKPERDYQVASPNKTLLSKVETDFANQAREIISINPKLERQKATSALISKVKEQIKDNPESFGLDDTAQAGKEAYNAVDQLLYKMMRADILGEEKRIGARRLDEVREIMTEIDVLKKVHGSSLFTRGETQVMATVTLGGKEGEQMADSIRGVSYDKFYLHYTFPPYCVGEARGYRGVGRREIGHGNLAERALKGMIPEDYPYTVRLNCEVLESNGSSSMGSVCSGSMALMDAGVPVKAAVAGVAMGLVKEEENFKVLMDILGDEDHLGDMDFKVAGTDQGITAIQMDIKIAGITKDIFTEALEQARLGRLHILEQMAKTIASPRPKYKVGVPVIGSTKIEPDKIGALIGPGGKNIKAIQEEHGVSLQVEENGEVKILGDGQDVVDKVIGIIDMQITGPKVGANYSAKVVTIKEYGAFVDIVPGVSGLVHVSEIADERVNEVTDYINEGDTIEVKVLDVDRFGKIKLSAKAAKPLKKK